MMGLLLLVLVVVVVVADAGAIDCFQCSLDECLLTAFNTCLLFIIAVIIVACYYCLKRRKTVLKVNDYYYTEYSRLVI